MKSMGLGDGGTDFQILIGASAQPEFLRELPQIQSTKYINRDRSFGIPENRSAQKFFSYIGIEKSRNEDGLGLRAACERIACVVKHDRFVFLRPHH